MDESLSDDRPPSPPASWKEAVPERYRLRRGWTALSIGIATSLTMWVIQVRNGVGDPGIYVFAGVPAAIGGWRYLVWRDRTSVTRYATLRRVYSERERVIGACKWVAAGASVTALIALLAAVAGNLAGAIAPALIAFPVFGVGALGTYLRKEQIELTREGRAQQLFDEQQKKGALHNPAEWLGSQIKRRAIRFPLAALLIYWAYQLAHDPKPDGKSALILAIFALICVYEIALFAVGIGLVIGAGYLLFSGIAGLPVSVAVIIGAIIIASAIRK